MSSYDSEDDEDDSWQSLPKGGKGLPASIPSGVKAGADALKGVQLSEFQLKAMNRAPASAGPLASSIDASKLGSFQMRSLGLALPSGQPAPRASGCPAVLRSGLHKGSVCGATAKYNGFCGKHKQ